MNEYTGDSAQVNKQATNMHPIILSEDGTLKYNFMVSLENIVTAKIISNFWMNKNNQMEIMNLFRSRPEHDEFAEKWRQIESNIATQVSNLFLPVDIIQNMKNIVPVIGNSLLSWIVYHDEYVLKSREFSPYSAVDFTGHVIWTARGKIDYAQTAKNILANNANTLSDVHKYEIACTYCFVDKISLLSVTIDDKYYSSTVGMDLNPMVQFWTVHTGKNESLGCPYFTQFHNPHNNRSIYEHLMWILIHDYRSVNEVPIMYVWNELNREEKNECIAQLIEQLGNLDIMYSILSNIDFEQQKKVFTECADSILVSILNDWLWEDYFLPTALHILDTMDPLHYVNVLEEVIKRKNKNTKEENKYLYLKFKFIFKQLWEKGSKGLKDFIYEHENGVSLAHLVLNSLSCKRDRDIVELILKDLTARQKRDIIFGSCGVNYCSFLIQNDRWDLLELFINHTLANKEDVSQLKQTLSREKEVIAEHFLNHEAFDKLENFMNWSFVSEEKKDEFRRSLAYSNVYFSTLKSISSSNKVDFTQLEKHFKWCAKNDLELLNEFKNEITKCPYGKSLINKLMKQQKYELVDKVLSWCFNENEKQISSYKCNMYKDFLKPLEH